MNLELMSCIAIVDVNVTNDSVFINTIPITTFSIRHPRSRVYYIF